MFGGLEPFDICDNGYEVLDSDSDLYYYDIPEESLAKYDSKFFNGNDLVVFNVSCADGSEPEIEKLWYYSDHGYIRAEFKCSNTKWSSDWAIFVPVKKVLGVIPNYPV